MGRRAGKNPKPHQETTNHGPPQKSPTENISTNSKTTTEDTFRPIFFSPHDDNQQRPVAVIKPLRVQHPYILLGQSDNRDITIPPAPTTVPVALARRRHNTASPVTTTREEAVTITIKKKKKKTFLSLRKINKTKMWWLSAVGL